MFLYLSVLVIPSILVIVLPIGLFFAVVYCLYRLRTDSELVVMYAAGMSRWQVARAIFGCAAGVMLLAYLVNMLLLPMAMRDMRDGRLAPDANSTLRVGFGTVKGYAPRDGVYYEAQTTIDGVLQKDTGERPFDSPPRLLDLARLRA